MFAGLLAGDRLESRPVGFGVESQPGANNRQITTIIMLTTILILDLARMSSAHLVGLGRKRELQPYGRLKVWSWS